MLSFCPTHCALWDELGGCDRALMTRTALTIYHLTLFGRNESISCTPRTAAKRPAAGGPEDDPGTEGAHPDSGLGKQQGRRHSQLSETQYRAARTACQLLTLPDKKSRDHRLSLAPCRSLSRWTPARTSGLGSATATAPSLPLALCFLLMAGLG